MPGCWVQLVSLVCYDCSPTCPEGVNIFCLVLVTPFSPPPPRKYTQLLLYCMDCLTSSNEIGSPVLNSLLSHFCFHCDGVCVSWQHHSMYQCMRTGPPDNVIPLPHQYGAIQQVYILYQKIPLPHQYGMIQQVYILSQQYITICISTSSSIHFNIGLYVCMYVVGKYSTYKIRPDHSVLATLCAVGCPCRDSAFPLYWADSMYNEIHV